MCNFREKFASTYVRHMHWRGRPTHSWQLAVIRKCLHMAAMAGFNSSSTTAVKMNMNSPMLFVHPVDSPSSLAATTGLQRHLPLLRTDLLLSNRILLLYDTNTLCIYLCGNL